MCFHWVRLSEYTRTSIGHLSPVTNECITDNYFMQLMQSYFTGKTVNLSEAPVLYQRFTPGLAPQVRLMTCISLFSISHKRYIYVYV
jgi:hypothetical protein